MKPNIHNVFHAAGIELYQGYGLTEAGPIVACNNATDHNRLGVGKPVDIATIKISGDCEVLVKSPSVMKGYYKNPAATSDAIDQDGWLHTGDTGELDQSGVLWLIGVKKQIFKLSSGLYADPVYIEKKLGQSEFISQAFVFGETQDFLSALIIPDMASLKSWSLNQNIGITGSPELLSHPNVSELFAVEIKKYNESCQRPDRIMKYEIVPDSSETSGHISSNNRKLNRDQLKTKYEVILSKFYSSP